MRVGTKEKKVRGRVEAVLPLNSYFLTLNSYLKQCDRFEFGRTKRFRSTNVRLAFGPGWFFDIYIQGSKYNFLELSLKHSAPV